MGDAPTPEESAALTASIYKGLENVSQAIVALQAERDRLRDMCDELAALVIQYRDDLIHPVTGSGSLERRLKAINTALARYKEMTDD